MIRVATLEEFDQKHVEKLCRTLYTAFGVGCEHSGHVRFPPGLAEPYDAEKLLSSVEKVRSYADDKILYVTRSRLKERPLPTGIAPTFGFCNYGKDRAIVTIHPAKDIESQIKLISRHALHQVGHLWDLFHCLDPRCAMYPPWTPSFANGDSIFCTFCRDKSEQKIRLAKS